VKRRKMFERSFPFRGGVNEIYGTVLRKKSSGGSQRRRQPTGLLAEEVVHFRKVETEEKKGPSKRIQRRGCPAIKTP